jgi:hypothetical protein
MSDQRYPLSWPEGWKRCVNRTRARFGKGEQRYINGQPSSYRNRELSVNDATTRIRQELGRMGISDNDCLISTNVPLRMDGLPRSDGGKPQDPGAAVYWKDSRGRSKCMAIDRYDRVADNLAAIAATLDAMRSIERHGGAEILERTFLGFAALPAAASVKNWREVLQFHPTNTPTVADITERYRAMAAKRHPDQGGSAESFHELTAARDTALREIGA